FIFFMLCFFFFFQAEDGIRDKLVTGVRRVLFRSSGSTYWNGSGLQGELTAGYEMLRASNIRMFMQTDVIVPFYSPLGRDRIIARSEERRVGKECRSRLAEGR